MREPFAWGWRLSVRLDIYSARLRASGGLRLK